MRCGWWRPSAHLPRCLAHRSLSRRTTSKRSSRIQPFRQLGYMALALGTGAWVAGIFHLMTHAFFKGLLFLGCGSVIHGMHGEQDMQKMGNLRKYMPVTFLTFLIGALANAGVIPLPASGARTRSSSAPGRAVSTRLGQDDRRDRACRCVHDRLLYVPARLPRPSSPKSASTSRRFIPHESKSPMTIPLIVLAVATVLVGLAWLPARDGVVPEIPGASLRHCFRRGNEQRNGLPVCGQ